MRIGMRFNVDDNDQTNPSLLRRIRGRDNDQAWNEFDSLYRPMLRRFAQARGLGDADIEDVVQHCMTAVYVHIDGFTYDPKRGRFKGWLRTMVNNRCRDLLRSRRRDDVAELEQLETMPSQGSSPEDAFEKIWAEEHLNHCLRILRGEVDQPTFTAFHRYVLESQTAEDVCRELNLDSKKLYKIKHRLTQRLRDLMGALIGEEFVFPTNE